METQTVEIDDCPKGFNTQEAIVNGFNADDVCMNCKNTTYNNGVLSCKYSRVN